MKAVEATFNQEKALVIVKLQTSQSLVGSSNCHSCSGDWHWCGGEPAAAVDIPARGDSGPGGDRGLLEPEIHRPLRWAQYYYTTEMWVVACSSMSGVSYGSYNFYEQRRAGYVCCYSLKNPSHPEFVLRSQAGVALVLEAVCDPITQKMLHFREPLSLFAYQAFKHNT